MERFKWPPSGTIGDRYELEHVVEHALQHVVHGSLSCRRRGVGWWVKRGVSPGRLEGWCSFAFTRMHWAPGCLERGTGLQRGGGWRNFRRCCASGGPKVAAQGGARRRTGANTAASGPSPATSNGGRTIGAVAYSSTCSSSSSQQQPTAATTPASEPVSRLQQGAWEVHGVAARSGAADAP